MKNLVLVFVVAFAFSPMAMASDIAFYVGSVNPGWYETPDMLADVETIIAETGGMFGDIQQYDDDQLDEFGAWADDHTNNGVMDIIWLNGCMPSVLYQFPNVNPDGSCAEEWLDGGNMFINVGDWFGYMSYEGGSQSADNGPSGAANILDLSSGIIVDADGTQLTVTPTGKEYLPSLNDPAKTDRPVALAEVQAPWEVAAIFASTNGTDDAAAEAQADPVVLHNTETDGYVALINQAAGGPDGWIDDRGLTSAEFIGNWVNDVIKLGRGNPLAHRPTPKNGSLHEDTWINLSWSPGVFAVSHDVYLSDNFEDVDADTGDAFRGNQGTTFYVAGFPGFAYPDGLVPGTTYYWRIDEVNDTEPNSPWKGNVWSFSIPPKTAYNPDPADAAESVDPDVQLSWTPGFGAKLHTVYFGDNFDDVNNAAGDSAQGTTTYTPGPLKSGKTYYWRVDEFDIIDTYKGDVWSFTTQGAVVSLKPANGAVDVKQTQILSWIPGEDAASHDVYFGTDKEVVRDADTGSPEYKDTRNLGAESYDPGKLEWDTTYYWRIDEVNIANPDNPWIGPVWSFTTANFLIVDDFEDYDAGDNQIWFAWHDGLGYGMPGTKPYAPGNGTGSAVGDETTGSYTEETIVHGGNQSMPFWYDNSVFRYSEATLTLTHPRNWTERGVNTLTIWFRGDSDNAAETLYVALNGSAVVNHVNPNAAQIDEWTEWNIDLQAFADQGVNLSNVNSITLGLGNRNNPIPGGEGKLYYDDIRLYRKYWPIFPWFPDRPDWQIFPGFQDFPDH
jgi:hypothetical protein